MTITLNKIQTNSYEYRGWTINVYRVLERGGDGIRKTYAVHAVLSNWHKLFSALNPNFNPLERTGRPYVHPERSDIKRHCTETYRQKGALKRCLCEAIELIDKHEGS